MGFSHRWFQLFVAWLFVASILLSCGSDDSAESGGPSVGEPEDVIQLLVGSAERAAVNNDAATTASELITAVGGDLYGELRADADGNLAVSPYSIVSALAMTRAGAAGTTAAEMDTVLHVDLVDDLDAAIGSLDGALSTRPGTFPMPEGDPVEIELSFGNALWPQQGFEFEASFLDTLVEHYGTGVYAVDYVTDSEGARGAINDWVSDQTQQRIPELITPGVLDNLTRLVLTNAVYLNAPWQFPFQDGATADAEFELLDGTTVDTPRMRLSESLGYATGDGWQAVALPYVEGDLAMVVLVPDAGKFDAVEAALSANLIVEVQADLAANQVNFGLPKWEFRAQTDLKAPLASLGMPSAFSDSADFSNMSSGPLFISDVLHEVFVSVDERGTEAAAATAVAMSLTAAPADPPIDLMVNRPFLFWITDQPTGAALFLGRVLDPTQS